MKPCERCGRPVEIVVHGPRLRTCKRGVGCRRRNRDLVGFIAIVKRPIESRGGAKFRRGELVRVDGTWRGFFHLEKLVGLRRYCAGSVGRSIRVVSEYAVHVTDVRA